MISSQQHSKNETEKELEKTVQRIKNKKKLDAYDWGDSENRHSLILDFFSHIAQGNAQDNYL